MSKVRFYNRIPVSSDTTRHDFDAETIRTFLLSVTGKDEFWTPEINIETIKEALEDNREYQAFKHEYYENEKLPAIQEIVRNVANTIDLIIPAAKGDSAYAQPLLTLMDQMLEFLSEMNAEIGPVRSSSDVDDSHIGSLFCDMASTEMDLLTEYNRLPRAFYKFKEYERDRYCIINNNQK